MADFDAGFAQHAIDLPQEERIPDVGHPRQADDLGTGAEVTTGLCLEIR